MTPREAGEASAVAEADVDSEDGDALVEALRVEIAPELDAALSIRGGTSGLELAVPLGKVADDTMKVRVRDARGAAAAFLLCSPASHPEAVEGAVQRAAAAHAALGPELGVFVLQPMRTGRWRGRSYAIYPHCTALPNAGLSWYLGRRLWRHTLRRWLLASITATAREATPEERETLFSRTLGAVESDAALSRPVREAAARGHSRLERGEFTPRLVLMHGDLWRENVLQRAVRPEPGRWGSLVLIDWAGSRCNGHPIYDLVRLEASFDPRGRGLAQQLALHGALLGYSTADAETALLASLGELRMRLGEFPIERFRALVEDCAARLRGVNSS